MNSTTYITLDMQAPETGVIAYAKQNDKLSRRLSATLKDGAVSWAPPTGAAAAIRYSKPDGTGGFYDVLEDSSPAIIVSGNVALMTLAEQCVAVPGQVCMELNFYTSAGAKLTSFTWLLNVEASVLTDATIVSSSYYNVLTAQVAQTLQYKNDAASSAQAAAASAALAQQISQQGKGWFATDTALKAAFPTGQNGWWAIVGAGDNIWTWDADTNAWVNTHTQTDLSNYYTKAQADAAFLGKTASAEDTKKFGGQLPSYYAAKGAQDKVSFASNNFPVSIGSGIRWVASTFYISIALPYAVTALPTVSATGVKVVLYSGQSVDIATVSAVGFMGNTVTLGVNTVTDLGTGNESVSLYFAPTGAALTIN